MRTRQDRCPATGKRRFRDHQQAVQALHSIGNLRQRHEHDGVDSPRRETRCYPCEQCSGWHLTSRTTWLSHRPSSQVTHA